MSKTKPTQPDTTLITLEMDNHTTLDAQRRPVRRVTVTARKGEVGYVGEAQVADIQADLLPILQHIQTVFFRAEVDGLPAFPDMNQLEPTPDAAPAQPDTAPLDTPAGSSSYDADADPEGAPEALDSFDPQTDGDPAGDGQAYTLSFYGSPTPDEAPLSDGDPAQPGLF